MPTFKTHILQLTEYFFQVGLVVCQVLFYLWIFNHIVT